MSTAAPTAPTPRPQTDASRPPAETPRPETEALRQALNHLLGAQRRLRGRDHNRAGGLTYAQLRSIAALGREREMTAGQLARSADLNAASVTSMLDHLEEGGIVARQRSTRDRRVCNVSLTPEGWELLEGKLAAYQDLWEERMAHYSDEELATAARVMADITALVDSIATERQ